jgi:MAP/microtubule affinity-regulating kinase
MAAAATDKKSSSSSTSSKKDNPDSGLTSIGNYLFQKTVGEGNFAKVKLAKHKLTGQEVPIVT